MSDKKYSNLHPKEIEKLKKAFSIGIKKDPYKEKEYNKKLRKEILDKAKTNPDSKYYKKKESTHPDAKYYKKKKSTNPDAKYYE